MPEMTRHEKLLAEAESLLAQSERETERLRDVVELLRETLREKPAESAQIRIAGASPDFASMSGTKAAEMVLQAYGRPMHIMKIVDAMQGRGFNVGDPKRYRSALYANMIRQKNRFRRVKPGTFALVHPESSELPLTQ